MKNLITLLLLCIGLSVNAQLTSVTEGGNTGQRLSVSNASNHGDIGSKAVDLSYSNVSSTILGATGQYSLAVGVNTKASGAESTAMGEFTTASGLVSTAMGIATTASGTFSTAMGSATTASGTSSTAMGEGTTASGERSTAMGEGTKASDYASTVIGQYNSSGSTATSAGSFSTSAPAFVIGNGTGGSSRSDAFKVMFNGDATVSNDLTIEGSLILGGESYTSFSGGGALSTVSEGGNTGVRLSSSDAANHGDIGDNAVDLSYSGSASSTRGATGSRSTAMGQETTASGNESTAMGRSTTARGGFSTAMGQETTAGGQGSTAMGLLTTAKGNYSTAMGYQTTASGRISAAMGFLTTASGELSTAMGEETRASGYASTAMGYETTASDYASTAIGQYNSSGSSVTSATSFSTSAPAFVIGNGTGSSSRSDAFKVMFNGDATVSNDLTIEGSLILGGESYTSFSGGGALSAVSEGGNTGVRLSSSDAANHGDIGDNAVDLSYSGSASSTRGATGSRSTAMGQEATASGNVSTAMGRSTTASGEFSTAMGEGTTANGYVSTALGINTTASGNYSTAIGAGTTASGNVSTAMGLLTTASDYASTAIGQYNSSGSTATSADSFSTSAPAFVVGNGTDDSSRSDAFKVMFNGDATVSNDLTIEGSLILGGESYTSFSGGGALSTVSEGGNTGVRLSSSDAANHGDIGDNAVDLSYSDVSSTTFGATGQYSVAMGLKAIANGNVSTAMGADTRANGYVSTALGINTTASGGFSTAIGAGTTASGNVSTAMGEGTKASDYASTVIGQFNSSGSTATSAGSFSEYAPAFVVGNGTGDSNRSDAFKVMFNGDAIVSNDLTVNGDVTVSSDARLKANIVSLGATLSKLLNIDGKTYTVKKNGAQKIGVLAQDIQEVFPELVSEDKEGMLSVNYQGLIPVLINALKEQQKEIEYFRAQEKRIERLEQLIQN